jgi:hypothetical protein
MTNVLRELLCGGNARSSPTFQGIASGLPTIRPELGLYHLDYDSCVTLASPFQFWLEGTT